MHILERSSTSTSPSSPPLTEADNLLDFSHEIFQTPQFNHGEKTKKAGLQYINSSPEDEGSLTTSKSSLKNRVASPPPKPTQEEIDSIARRHPDSFNQFLEEIGVKENSSILDLPYPIEEIKERVEEIEDSNFSAVSDFVKIVENPKRTFSPQSKMEERLKRVSFESPEGFNRYLRQKGVTQENLILSLQDDPTQLGSIINEMREIEELYRVANDILCDQLKNHPSLLISDAARKDLTEWLINNPNDLEKKSERLSAALTKSDLAARRSHLPFLKCDDLFDNIKTIFEESQEISQSLSLKSKSLTSSNHSSRSSSEQRTHIVTFLPLERECETR